MSTRIPNIQKNKKFNFEDEDVTPNVQEQMPIKFDYPFKSRNTLVNSFDLYEYLNSYQKEIQDYFYP